MGEAMRVGRPYFLLLAIFAVGRWLMGTFGVPYERGQQVFSIVILTYMSCIYYGAFGRRWAAWRIGRAMAVGATFGVVSQVVVLLATVVSYAFGLQTYFVHPWALNSPGPVPFHTALGTRVAGLVANTLFSAIGGALGWSLGGLLPQEK